MNHLLSQAQAAVIRSPDIEAMIERREICRVLCISDPTFFRMVNSGRIPALKIGGRWKMTPQALRDFIASPEISDQSDSEK